MNTKRYFLLKLFALFSISLLLLTSCGDGNESPGEVIQKFKQEATDIKSGDISANVVVKGVGQGAAAEEATAPTQETMDLTGNLAAKFDRRNDEARTADIKVALKGNLNAADKSFSGSIAFNVVSVSDDFYVNLSKLEASDESLEGIQPFVEKYIGKWLHVSKDFIPENIRNLQKEDEVAKIKQEQLEKLFIETSLFSVTKEYGIEKVNGEKCYHYGVALNPEGVKEYIRKAAIIDGRELTDAEVEDASKIVSYLSNAELWIGVKDYYLYKGVITLTGGVPENGSEVKFDITMDGNAYNKNVEVIAPKDAEEFNPFELFMGTDAMDGGAFTDEMPEGIDQATLDALMEAQGAVAQ